MREDMLEEGAQDVTHSGPPEGELSVWLLPEEEVTEVQPEKPTDVGTLRRVVRVWGFLVAYLLLVLPLAYFSYLLPSVVLFPGSHEDTPTITDDWMQVWPWSTFTLWSVCMIVGYSFVASVTEKRQNPFKSRFDKYQCLLKLVLISPLVYLCGPVRSLWFGPDANQLHSFLYNAWFVVFFFVGLQFTYLDSILLFRRAGDKFGTPSLWKTYTRAELALIIPIVVSIVGCVSWHFYLIFLYRLVIWYSVFYGLIFTVLIVPTIIFRKSHYLHMHHYAIFGVLIPFFAFPNLFSLLCLGIASGVYVEGIGRWGMAWFWYPGAQREY